MAFDDEATATDPRLRHARLATLLGLGAGLAGGLVAPVIDLLAERRPLWIVLGTLGLLGFACTQAGALYAALTPWLGDAARRRLLVGYAVAAVLSVPLVAPIAGDTGETWAWLGGVIAGSAILVVGRRMAFVVAVAALATSVAIATWLGDEPVRYAVITGVIGLSVAGWNGLPVWLWSLVFEAQQGRHAQARLAVTEERLRVARDVHDLLGHNLSVIALKSELASRLAPTDPERAGAEAAEVRQLAASALTEMREVIHGYRSVDLPGQLVAVQRVLRSSGVKCTVSLPVGEISADVGAQLAPVLREASTNVLRHSRANWCSIEIERDGEEVRMRIRNDGAVGGEPDRHSYGLRGLSERLAATGGRLRTHRDDGVFVLDATVREAV